MMPDTQAVASLRQPLLRPIERLAVLRPEQHHPDHFSRHAAVQQIPHGREVAQALGHLPPVHHQHLVVHPDLREGFVGVGATGLGELVLVVGELEVEAAAVDVEGPAEEIPRHRRAFDVPARAAAAPGRLPAGQALARGLPEHEVHRIALVGRHVHPRAGDHVVHRAAREAAVGLVGGHREEDVTPRLVGVALGDQRLDHGDHLRQVLSRAGLVGRAQAAERVHVLVVPADRLVRDLLHGAAGLLGASDDLVVDVGEVADVDHPVLAVDVAQEAEEHVEHHRRAGVAEMRPVVDRGAADIHPHATVGLRDPAVPMPVERHEGLHLSGERVPQADRMLRGRGVGLGHGDTSRDARAGDEGDGPRAWKVSG